MSYKLLVSRVVGVRWHTKHIDFFFNKLAFHYLHTAQNKLRTEHSEHNEMIRHMDDWTRKFWNKRSSKKKQICPFFPSKRKEKCFSKKNKRKALPFTPIHIFWWKVTLWLHQTNSHSNLRQSQWGWAISEAVQ